MADIQHYTSNVLTRSQAKDPDKLLDVLAVTAVKESWVMALINLHTAIFFGLILLASGYGEMASLTYLSIQLSVTLIASVMMALVIRQGPEKLLENRQRTIGLLQLSDAFLSAGWGISILLYFIASPFEQADTLVVILFAAGISSAALSAKLLSILIVGRLLVFSPTIVFLILAQPPDWALHATSLILSFAVVLGIGYAIHIQFLREASAVVQLAESRAQITNEARFREHFLKSITHDLRQPLSSLGLHYRSLKKKESDIAELAEGEAIESCIDTANEIMRNVSKLAWVSDSLPEPELQPIHLGELLKRVVMAAKPEAAQKKVKVSWAPTNLFCYADKNYLERIVQNLIENAIEHTSKGRILVGVRNRRSIGNIEIQVLDTGCGIEQKEWGNIFDDYHRIHTDENRESGHLGLGLSIVKNMTLAMGGSNSLQSKSGRGSCFSVMLKLAPSKNRFATTSTIEAKNILIVDDDPDYALSLANTIEKMGGQARAICDPAEIKELFSDGLPDADCYIVDYDLNQSNTGLGLLTLAKTDATKLLISNFDTPQVRKGARKIGVKFEPKPHQENDIRDLLNRLK